ncbi:predicted protein [Nematostella vectensis]|uniref:Ig-like domain-containing protein n=1 Tax=Nematostella vectensis TaxID=45351 RepID=A7RUN7_NEMVE|nr:predicted protein [Nematostella vectensis]|eukprot:XP_001636840.1 predicted protein [Nematostella vectensis]
MGFFFVLCFALDFVISQTAGLITFTRLPPSQVQVFEGTHNLSLTWSFHVVEGENIFTLSFNRGENTIGSHSNDDNKTTIFQSYKTDYSLKVKRLEAVLTINKVKTSLEGEYSIKIVGGFNGTTYQSRGTSLKVLVPLSITSPANKTIIVLENNTVELVCETTGSPPPNITWTKGYRVIGTGSPLRLAGVGRLNDGCYDCTADNGMGTSKNASVCLDVQYPADASLIASPSKSCVHGNVTLTCTAGRAKPPVTGFLYFLNGTRLGASNGSFTVNISGPGLHEFSCAAVNAVGAGEKGSSMIDVKAPTSILKLPLTITVVEGSNLTIPCDVTGSEPINVSWSRDNVAGFVGSRDLSFKPIDRNLDSAFFISKLILEGVLVVKTTTQVSTGVRDDNLSTLNLKLRIRETTIETTVEWTIETTIETKLKKTIETILETTIEKTIETKLKTTIETILERTIEKILETTIEKTIDTT